MLGTSRYKRGGLSILRYSAVSAGNSFPADFADIQFNMSLETINQQPLPDARDKPLQTRGIPFPADFADFRGCS